MKRKLLEMDATMKFHLCNIVFCQQGKYLQFNKAFSWHKCCKKYFLKVAFISMKKIVAVPRFRQCSYEPPLQSTPPTLVANLLLIGTKLIGRWRLKNSSFFFKKVCPQLFPLTLLVGLSGWIPLPISYYSN